MQIPSLIGAVLLLLAYGGQEMGLLRREAPVYSLLNITGSALLLWRALSDRSYGFVLLESFWLLVSLLGLLRSLRRPR